MVERGVLLKADMKHVSAEVEQRVRALQEKANRPRIYDGPALTQTMSPRVNQ
jgi:hypothetical protein